MNQDDLQWIELLDKRDNKIRLLSGVLNDAVIKVHRQHIYQGISRSTPYWRLCDDPFCIRVRNALDD